jgi:hypothetical protein
MKFCGIIYLIREWTNDRFYKHGIGTSEFYEVRGDS